jgi:AcrR family transcriptional regulator
VAQGGFREAQIAAVASAAGLSTGSIYRYFPSKADLFVELLTEAAKHEVEVLRAAASGPGTAADRLRATVESFVRRAFEGPWLAYAFIAEPAEPEVDAQRIRVRRQFGDVFRTILRDGMASGEFPQQNDEAASACIVGAFTEAVVGPIAPTARRLADQEKLVDSIGTFCVRAVSATPAAAPAVKRSRLRESG